MKAAGVDGCQGTPWSEELDGKELHGAVGGEHDKGPRESAASGELSASTSVVLCCF